MATDMSANAHQDAQDGQGCPCACHTGDGYRISCEHCGSAARFLGRAPAGVTAVPTVDAAAVLETQLGRAHVEYAALRRLLELTEAKWDTATERVALLEGLLRDLVTKGEAMKEAFFTGDDTQEAIACMEWDAAALADGG